MRYGKTTFDHHLLYFTQDIYWIDPTLGTPNRVVEMREQQVMTDWFEIVVGVKVYTFKNIYLMTLGNIKIKNKVGNNRAFSANFIPGYGLNNGNTTLGWNIQLAYRFQKKSQ